jgi:ribonuclease J
MNIKIHRGTHQIGGCVTEYEYDGWRLFVDYGEELPGGPKSGDLQIEGLTHGDISKSALLITHYHGDHIGSITKLPKELLIYIGKVGREILLVLSDHLKSVDGIHQEMVERLHHANTFEAGKLFSYGPFSIMPITVDHSAFDAYAFKIEAGGVSAFHTGDFRTHGFRSKKLPEVIHKYVGEVDYVVCEGTNVARPDATNQTERELQQQFEEQFKANKGNVVYLSSTNIDRLFSLYHAALRAKRVFLVDAYQKKIMDIVTQKDSLWGKSELYQYGEYEPKVLKYDKGEFLVTDEFKDFLDKLGYVLVARATPRFGNLVERIPGEKQQYLSMWGGYVKEGAEAYNKDLANSLGEDFKYMHTSGHSDMNSMREVFRLLHPKALIPIHTDAPEKFAELFSAEWSVILLNDGESVSTL